MNAKNVLDGVIQQFGSRVACLRELVQNSIDADTDRVEVRFERDGNWKVLHVEDFGCGMTLAHVDEFLLNVFKSSKEGDLESIGRFGIGFVSVFALKPSYVVVRTSRDGEHTRLVIDSDLGIRYYKGEPRLGTQVSLYLDMTDSAFEKLVGDAVAFLRKSCRYVEAELVVVRGEGDEEDLTRPFELALPLVAEAAGPDGTEIVVGYGQTAPSWCLMNRRLVLQEGEGSLCGGATVLASSRELEHNMARNAVIQDDGFERFVGRVRGLVERELLPQVVDRLRRRAHGASTLAAVGHVVAHFGADAVPPPFSQVLEPRVFDLVADGKMRKVSLGRLLDTARGDGLWGAAEVSPLAEAASWMRPVLLGPSHWPAVGLVGRLAPEAALLDVDTLAVCLPVSEAEGEPFAALCAAAAEALPGGLRATLARFCGVEDNGFVLRIAGLGAPWPRSEKPPAQGSLLALSVDHPLTCTLGELARVDPPRCALLLSHALAAARALDEGVAGSACDRWLARQAEGAQ